MKIIDEVKAITAEKVAEKQNAATLNFPKIISKIKAQAGIGASSCTVPLNQMNEYDKQLLEKEGFYVRLIDEPKNNYPDYYKTIGQYKQAKVWEITW